MSCWIRLGIEPTTDETLIRNAYRARLPAHHPETDPEGFQALRMAYENAMRLAREEEEDESEEQSEEAEQEIVAIPQAFVNFCELLDDPARRFNFAAWQSFVLALDELSLDELDELSWGSTTGWRVPVRCPTVARTCWPGEWPGIDSCSIWSSTMHTGWKPFCSESKRPTHSTRI
jgi:hypothetical protein